MADLKVDFAEALDGLVDVLEKARKRLYWYIYQPCKDLAERRKTIQLTDEIEERQSRWRKVLTRNNDNGND